MKPAYLTIAALFCASVGAGLALGAFLDQPADLAAMGCLPGSRGRVCIVERLGANVIAVPKAEAIPEMVELGDQVWLRASGLPPGQPVTVTLTAPNGTSCSIGDVRTSGTMAEAFAVPADCADSDGTWTATITAGPVTVTAGFLAVTAGRVPSDPE